MYTRDIDPRDGVFVNSGVENPKYRADTCLGFNSIRLTAVEYRKRYSTSYAHEPADRIAARCCSMQCAFALGLIEGSNAGGSVFQQ
jgi:hypothetical protein